MSDADRKIYSLNQVCEIEEKAYQKGKKDANANIKPLIKEIHDSVYQQGKTDGAREFADRLRVNFDLLAWNNSDEVIDYTLSEWQKGTEEL